MIVKTGINGGRREEQEHGAHKVYYQTIVKIGFAVKHTKPKAFRKLRSQSPIEAYYQMIVKPQSGRKWRRRWQSESREAHTAVYYQMIVKIIICEKSYNREIFMQASATPSHRRLLSNDSKILFAVEDTKW